MRKSPLKDKLATIRLKADKMDLALFHEKERAHRIIATEKKLSCCKIARSLRQRREMSKHFA